MVGELADGWASPVGAEVADELGEPVDTQAESTSPVRASTARVAREG